MFSKWLWKLCTLLFARKIGFKFIIVNKPLLGMCPGVLDTETVTSFLGLTQPIITVKATNGMYSLCVHMYLTRIRKENSRLVSFSFFSHVHLCITKQVKISVEFCAYLCWYTYLGQLLWDKLHKILPCSSEKNCKGILMHSHFNFV